MLNKVIEYEDIGCNIETRLDEACKKLDYLLIVKGLKYERLK